MFQFFKLFLLVSVELLITCDYNFLTFGFPDDSIISNLGRLKLTNQGQEMESPTKTDIELSSDSDKDKCGPSDPSDKVQEAPVELKGEVHNAC